MQFTILSVKLPNQTDEQFNHEFRTIHARETNSMASSLGILSRYVQGINLTTQARGVTNPPLLEKSSLQSFAQLTWPSTNVLKGSLGTTEYKESAGKHIFAKPAQIFLTERLEADMHVELEAEASPVLLVMVLIPASEENEGFRNAWDMHAAKFKSQCLSYQRNMAMNLSRTEVDSILGGTQFDPNLWLSRGGYEEFVFRDLSEAQDFVDRNIGELEKSYKGFCSGESYFAVFDYVVQYSEKDMGIRQYLVGAMVSKVLQTKVFFGM